MNRALEQLHERVDGQTRRGPRKTRLAVFAGGAVAAGFFLETLNTPNAMTQAVACATLLAALAGALAVLPPTVLLASRDVSND